MQRFLRQLSTNLQRLYATWSPDGLREVGGCGDIGPTSASHWNWHQVSGNPVPAHLSDSSDRYLIEGRQTSDMSVLPDYHDFRRLQSTAADNTLRLVGRSSRSSWCAHSFVQHALSLAVQGGRLEIVAKRLRKVSCLRYTQDCTKLVWGRHGQREHKSNSIQAILRQQRMLPNRYSLSHD